MDRALKLLEQRSVRTIVIQRGAGCEVVLLSDVVYCEALGRKACLHKSGGTTVDYYDRLEDLKRRADERFFKCHRGYLANLGYARGHWTAEKPPFILIAGNGREIFICWPLRTSAPALRRLRQNRTFQYQIGGGQASWGGAGRASRVLYKNLGGGIAYDATIKSLEQQPAQVERELNAKDTNTYRKQHSTFTQLF